ncbi:MAG: gamma-glutamyltransferase family protein [Chloroflexota bacterium]
MLKSKVKITRTEVVAENGVVAGGHELEAEVGVQILQRGGNAVDAAIAAQFVANVVEPSNCGIGGHGFLAVYDAEHQETTVFDWGTKLPRGVREDMFELEEGTAGVFGWRKVKDNAQSIGYLASETPATVQAMWATHQRYGHLPWEELLQPAIELAEEGIPVDWRMSRITAANLADLRRFPATAEIYLRDGLPLREGNFFRPGDALVQKDLGRALRRIAAEGVSAITEGEIPAALEADMAAHGGIITAQDVAECDPLIYQEPHYTYRDYTYVSGGCPVLVEALNILECFDLASVGPDDPTYRHLTIEAMRRAWVDCLTYMGDPAFVRVPDKGIRSKAYAQERAATIDLKRASSEVPPGDPWQYEPGGRPADTITGGQPGPRQDGGHTTQVCVIDGRGNMVTVHTSLGLSFGSKVVIPRTGILLGNGIESFDPEPGKPNSLVPGKLPLHVVPIVLMFRDEKPFATLSASGGRRILGACLHIMVNLVDFDMGMQQAIEALRLHTELDEVFVDSCMDVKVLNALKQMGHPIVEVEEGVTQVNFARPVGVMLDPLTGKIRGGADPLRSTGVAGF